MESHEKAQSETNEDEDQEEDTDILIVPIGFVIRKFIIGASNGVLAMGSPYRGRRATDGKSVTVPGEIETPEPLRRARPVKQRFLQPGR